MGLIVILTTGLKKIYLFKNMVIANMVKFH